jgi:hypothetical protein
MQTHLKKSLFFERIDMFYSTFKDFLKGKVIVLTIFTSFCLFYFTAGVNAEEKVKFSADELKRQIRAIEKDIVDNLGKELEFRSEVLEFLLPLEKIKKEEQFLADSVNKKISEINKIITVLKELNESATIAPHHRSLSDALASLRKSIFRPEAIYRGTIRRLKNNYRGTDYEKKVNNFDFYEEFDESHQKWRGLLVNTNNFIDLAYENKDLTKKDVSQQLKTVYEEIGKLQTGIFQNLFNANKSTVEKISNEISSVWSKKIESINKDISDKKKGLIVIRKQLKEAISGSKAVDKSLIDAVFMMIGAIVFLFSMLYFMSGSLSKLIIKERSLVEVISIAFMLLTIIILGIGDKIMGETLGALLGTIAGYIFGKKVGESPKPQ